MKRGNKSDRRKQKMDQRHNSVQLPSSSGYATEQPLRRRWGPAADPAPEPAMPARFELENLENRAQQTELTDTDMEDFQRTRDVVKLEDFQRASDEETAAAAAAAATEHSQDASTPDLASQ